MNNLIAQFLSALVLFCFVGTQAYANSCSQSNVTNVSRCADRTICSRAVYKSPQGKAEWSRIFKRHVAEAKRRGMDLNCSLPPLRQSFVKLSKADRMTVQSTLAGLNLYTSSVDGLYGQGTASALRQYNEQYANVGNLAKQSNANKLLALILESTLEPVGTNPESKDDDTPSTVVPTKEQAPKPKTVADLATYFEDKDYKSALQIAQELAVSGEAEAQAYLGKMYADGLGTLQLSKNAHMWFNIASLNGSVEAIDGRNAVAATMSQDAVNEAQDMAVKCIQSNYADCGLLVKQNTAVTAAPNSRRSIVNGDVLISNFKDQSSLRRKQLQFALKKLGLYSSAVDGLWGGNTSKAFTNYIKINEIEAKDAEEVFVSILSKVDVPSSFTPLKKKQNVIKHTTKNNIAKETPTTRSGWTATSQNPKLTFEDAKDICEAKAIAEGNSYLSANKPIDRYSSIDCTGYGFNSYSCSRSSGGGVAGGILRAWDQAENRNAAEKLAKAVAKACMADYGWIKK